MRYSIIPWNEREKLISTIPSTTLRTSYFRTFVLFLFLPFFCLLTVSPIDVHHQMVSCVRLLSELWGILSIGATSGLTMPHRCDNHPLSTWPSCRLSKNNTALFTRDVRLSVLSEWLWEMNIFISFVTNFCIVKNIFLGKDSWSCNSYVSPVCIQCLICRNNWKIDIAIKREKIQLSLVTLCWF